MYNFILKLLEDKEKESGKAVSPELLHNWVLQLQADEAELNAVVQASSANRQSLQEAYSKSREALGLQACEPHFAIDPTEPYARLEMQHRFDVAREAIFMSSSADIQRQFAPFPEGRRFYETIPGFPFMHSVAQELQELFSNAETMLVDKAWIPQEIADVAGIRINGHFETKNHWDLFQSFLGYQKIEDIFPLTWESIKSAPPFYQQPHEASDPANSPVPGIVGPANPPVGTQPFINQPHGPFDPANPPMSGVVGPSNPYGRAQPYNPTPQPKLPKNLPFRLDRGNPPPGVSDETWASLYKSADTQMWKTYQKGRGRFRESTISKAARNEGRTRDKAISKLIQRKVLTQDFVDLDV